MNNFAWEQFLKNIAIDYKLGSLERTILLLINRDFVRRKELQDLAEQELGIKREVFIKCMANIYRKLRVVEDRSVFPGSRFDLLKKKLDRDFSFYLTSNSISVEKIDYEIAQQMRGKDTLILNFKVTNHSKSYQNKIAKELVDLCKALNAYEIACGGNGLEIDDWQIFSDVPEAAEI